jgi:hypothetical protein
VTIRGLGMHSQVQSAIGSSYYKSLECYQRFVAGWETLEQECLHQRYAVTLKLIGHKLISFLCHNVRSTTHRG